MHLRIAMPLAVMAVTAPRLGPCRSFTALADPPNCEIGAGDPWKAGAFLAKSAGRRITGRVSFQEAEYLVLFACYRAEIGGLARADELLRLARPRFGTIQWIAWPYVWKWPPEDHVALNREARTRELDGLEHAQSMRTAMVPALTTELEFWAEDRRTNTKEDAVAVVVDPLVGTR